MDPRRRLIFLVVAGLGLGGCAVLATAEGEALAPALPREMMPVIAAVEPLAGLRSPTERPYLDSGELETGEGERRLVWAPGRVFAVRAAPLRVTVLVLPPGETLLTRAAGDTVRWKIGEAKSGEGEAERALVLLKPLERGLATNLVLTTSKRLYLIDLVSGGPEDFDASVSWIVEGEALAQPIVVAGTDPTRAGRYVIEPRGRAPRWTPVAVHDDGRRTMVEFGAELAEGEAPALFDLGADGGRRLIAWRQVGRTYVVDRLLDRAELRLGARRPQIVRIRRLPEAGS
ncbi:Conjugal transfer protein [compost metagenome]